MFQHLHKSMLGIDLGNWSCHVIYPFCRDIDDGLSRTDVKTQISQIKCLLGRKFSDPELQLELDYVPFRVIEGPDGCPVVHGRCKGKDRAFTPVEILAMLISSPEFQAYSSPCTCVGVPIYFTDQQKMDVLQAAKIAGLPASFCLLDETTAMVVAFKRNLFFEPQCIVAFVDIGHANMQVCFAEFNGDCSTGSPFERKRSVNILYKCYARSLGGREFDKVLFNYFASKIRKEYNIDLSENSNACVRLSEACERLKNKLSENNEASFCIEKFSGSIDVKGSITRKDFESLSISILKTIEVALKKALSESGLNVNKINYLEAIGKGCSIPAIIDIMTKIFGEKKRKTTYYEYVARGCAMEPRQQNITGTDRIINDLSAGRETSELVSSELNSEEEKAEDPEKFLWRRAMGEDGHLLTHLNDFLEENIHRIGRLEKTKDESYWLSKPNYFAEYSYSELQLATNNFHESFKLGEGGFGTVYKGILQSGTVAIKIQKEGSIQGAKEFNQEVEILSKVWHPNLVKLIGACTETLALIYEYLPNGSLEDRLRCKDNSSPLSWQARVRIAFEICSALSFLHCSKPHGIVHGDLKPDNILLDSDSTSKICDFGLCRELNWTTSASIAFHWTDCPKGTLAYMDPEYLSTGKTTPQYDVYSFGIMLLRLATCKNPQAIRHLVEEAQKKGTIKTLIDASAGPWPFKEAKRMISLGLRCSDPIRINRPDLSTEVLEEIKSMLQVANYLREFSYSELQDATNNFHESFKLGEGGFGIVYKGILTNSITVAIKMLKERSRQGEKKFNQEVEILSKVQHPNLVKLIGACAEPYALIYEYLPNGSLEDCLRCKDNNSPLSWQARVRIAFEICSALSFIHCSEPHDIVHGDLKPDNILLDENNTSKICNFGLCRELNYTTSESIPYDPTSCPKSTLAYMDPDYLLTGKTTPQYDVYSFGIILLWLVICKKPLGIRKLVEEAQKKGTLKALIDASAGPWPFKEAKKMISLGLRCSDPVRKNRPDLSTKVWKEIKSMAHVASASVSL